MDNIGDQQISFSAYLFQLRDPIPDFIGGLSETIWIRRLQVQNGAQIDKFI